MGNIRQKTIVLALLNLGIVSIVAQIVLIRELVISFYGNELFIGLILALWLISTGLGSLWLVRLTLSSFLFISNKKGIQKRKGEQENNILFWSYLIIPVVLVGAIILARLAKMILTESGVLPNLIGAGLWSMLVVAPVGLLLGRQFVLLARHLPGNREQAVSFAYIIESLGFVIGALIFNFILFQFTSLTVIFLIAVFCFILALIFSFSFALKKSIIIAALIIATAVSLLKTDLIDLQFSKWLYPGQNLLTSVNSKFGTTHITKVGEQVNFYYNGHLLANSQNKYHNELVAHLPVLLIDNPRNALIIGNAFTGLIKELNKYQLETIVYLELDKELVNLGFAATDGLGKIQDNSKRQANLKIINQDARQYLSETDQLFDVVIINYTNPSTLAENRYFTKEFFALIKSKLSGQNSLAVCFTNNSKPACPPNRRGIVVLEINTTPNYTFGAQNQLLSTLYQTLKNVYTYVYTLPDNEVIFLASQDDLIVDFARLQKKYLDLSLDNYYVTPDFIKWRFTSDRRQKLDQQLPAAEVAINSDFKPTLYYQQLKIFLEKMEMNYRVWWLFMAFSVIVAVWMFFRVRQQTADNRQQSILLFISGVPEFCLMSFEVILIFLFQTFHGYLYTQLSLIIALVLIGITLGGLVFRKLLTKINDKRLIKFSYLIIVIVFMVSLIMAWQYEEVFNYKFIYHLLSLLSGFAIGTKFPVINKLYLKNPPAGRISSNLGAVYGVDLIGGAAGALLAGILLLPVLGVVGSLGILAGLCGTGLVIILLFGFDIKNKI